MEDWDNKTGEHLQEDENKEMSLQVYCSLIDIPYPTFKKYVCADKDKRRVIGCSVGKPSVLDDETQVFATDVIRRKDRANDGLNKREAVDMIHDLKPELKRKQVERAFDRVVRPKNKDKLTGIVKASKCHGVQENDRESGSRRLHHVLVQPRSAGSNAAQ